MKYLDFEKKIAKLDYGLDKLREKQENGKKDYSLLIRKEQEKQNKLISKIYGNLNPWQIVQVARHEDRPHFSDYLDNIVEEFMELHGDRCFGDDKAITTGFGRINRYKVMIIGTNKGKNLDERQACYFGMPHPEGYRKALRTMKLAEKFHLPIITFIDTSGAYPGIGAEERGQAEAIARNLMEMSKLKTQILPIIIGEGGSGGALGLGVGDKLGMLEYAYYSVISPEGCAAILWKDKKNAPKAAKALKLTSKDLYELGIVDEIIKEPLGGAHRNPYEAYETVEKYIVNNLQKLKLKPLTWLVNERYQKLRKVGMFEIRKE